MFAFTKTLKPLEYGRQVHKQMQLYHFEAFLNSGDPKLKKTCVDVSWPLKDDVKSTILELLKIT